MNRSVPPGRADKATMSSTGRPALGEPGPVLREGVGPGAGALSPAASGMGPRRAPCGRPAHAVRPRVERGAVTAADGLVLVDKPAGITSHDVVAATRRLAATRKVGHAGTLDPMATGLLVVGVGRATRLLTYLVGADKAYLATIRLGQETLTEDAQGEVTAARGCPGPGSPPDWEQTLGARIEAALSGLRGPIMQVPSAVSAIKVDGVRSYTRVREGQEVTLGARPVTIHELNLLAQPRPATAADATAVVDLEVQVVCSSGTYVRALARDLGASLGCGAHLTALRRTRVGPFAVGEAVGLDALSTQVEADAATESPQGLAVLPLPDAARRCFASVELSEAEARALGYGQYLPVAVLDRARSPQHPIASKAVRGTDSRHLAAGFAPDGALVALLAPQGSNARPVLVFPRPGQDGPLGAGGADRAGKRSGKPGLQDYRTTGQTGQEVRATMTQQMDNRAGGRTGRGCACGHHGHHAPNSANEPEMAPVVQASGEEHRRPEPAEPLEPAGERGAAGLAMAATTTAALDNSPTGPTAWEQEDEAFSGVAPGRKEGNVLGLRDVSAPASQGCGCGGHGRGHHQDAEGGRHGGHCGCHGH